MLHVNLKLTCCFSNSILQSFLLYDCLFSFSFSFIDFNISISSDNLKKYVFLSKNWVDIWWKWNYKCSYKKKQQITFEFCFCNSSIWFCCFVISFSFSCKHFSWVSLSSSHFFSQLLIWFSCSFNFYTTEYNLNFWECYANVSIAMRSTYLFFKLFFHFIVILFCFFMFSIMQYSMCINFICDLWK